MNYTKIILPTRAQPDTLVAIFLLKKFGERPAATPQQVTQAQSQSRPSLGLGRFAPSVSQQNGLFPGISTASVEVWQVLPAGETAGTLAQKGVLLIDIGGGQFDHHKRQAKTTASELVARTLGIHTDPAIAKLLEYARRDDFFGKGTVSTDPLDRAFGLSGLVGALNKQNSQHPVRVVDVVMPLLEAHYAEEARRTHELPQEVEERIKRGEFVVMRVLQRKKNLRVALVNSDNASMSGYLRSQQGGRFDVVVQRMSSGHVNVLTRPTKQVDLRSLVACVRHHELVARGSGLFLTPEVLASQGRLAEIPDWYYDRATNSLQNGGLNPREVVATKIAPPDWRGIIERGLSEEFYQPIF